MMSDDDGFYSWLDDIKRTHKLQDEMFDRLFTEPCMKVPKVGDRVVVAAGLLGRGHLWIRLEAVVVELGDTSIRVEFTDRKRIGGAPDITWIHPALVTDVIETNGGTT